MAARHTVHERIQMKLENFTGVKFRLPDINRVLMQPLAPEGTEKTDLILSVYEEELEQW